jgi:hypothetical protein
VNNLIDLPIVVVREKLPLIRPVNDHPVLVVEPTKLMMRLRLSRAQTQEAAPVPAKREYV